MDPDSNTRRRKAVGVTFAMEPTQIFWSDCVFEFDYRYGGKTNIHTEMDKDKKKLLGK